ncbi:hypothetical protein HAX54_039916, partial [Datura stramonium]|nr:hypothetical protein [Datura stramonium]
KPIFTICASPTMPRGEGSFLELALAQDLLSRRVCSCANVGVPRACPCREMLAPHACCCTEGRPLHVCCCAKGGLRRAWPCA